ncbi:MAG: MogA/MoaB family molybdenum cofactor biosynthesis protein [Candidatus Krumholzibacteriia bacterium]
MSDAQGGLRLVVITASDRVVAGTYADVGGDTAQELAETFLRGQGLAVTTTRIVLRDDRAGLAAAIATAAADGVDIVLTTGGTGLGPRDVTPEATRDVVDREVPGLMEAVRAHHRAARPQVDLSRAVAGQAGRTLVLNLPGSPRAVGEFLAVLLPLLPHAVAVARGGERHPA